MRIIADTHAHLYPAYRLERAFDSAILNFSAYITPQSIKCLFLTERADCDCFSSLLNRQVAVEGYSIKDCPERGVLRVIRNFDKGELLVFAGRQIVSAEKIEVLAILCPEKVDDGENLKCTVERVSRVGGIPVLCWAPGKWIGKRGNFVMELVKDPSANPLFLGDSTHRIKGLAEPKVFCEGIKRGRLILAGSDPLPLPNEEFMLGSYGVIFEGDFDFTRPLSSLRTIVRSAGQVEFFGGRCGIARGLSRLFRNEMQRRFAL